MTRKRESESGRAQSFFARAPTMKGVRVVQKKERKLSGVTSLSRDVVNANGNTTNREMQSGRREAEE